MKISDNDDMISELAGEYISKVDDFKNIESYTEHAIAKYCSNLKRSMVNKYVADTNSKFKDGLILFESKVYELYKSRIENDVSNINIEPCN